MKYVSAFWQTIKAKWSTWFGALVIFLPEIQNYIPQLLPYLPKDQITSWIAGPGMRVIGVLIILLRARIEMLARVKQLRANVAS